MRRIIQIATALALLTCLTLACDKQDDVTEIFTGHRFKITGITWSGIKTVKEVSQFYAEGSTYWVSFNAQSVYGVLQSGSTIEGTWQAEGKHRHLTISLNRPQSADGMSELCTMVYRVLRDATRYSGDKNVLRIYKTDDTYIDLSSLE